MKMDDQIRIWEAFNTLGDTLEGLRHQERLGEIPLVNDIIKVRWQLNAIMNSWSERTVSDVIYESTMQAMRKE
mgnify:CR=1 FL=1